MRKLIHRMHMTVLANQRAIRACQYLAFFVGAVISVFWPTAMVTGVLQTLTVSWSLLFALSSLFCLLGVLTRTWVGEYIGLWGVLPCLILYAIGCFTDPLFPLRAGFGILFIGFALGKYARLLEVRSQQRMALAEAQSHRVMGR